MEVLPNSQVDTPCLEVGDILVTQAKVLCTSVQLSSCPSSSALLLQ